MDDIVYKLEQIKVDANDIGCIDVEKSAGLEPSDPLAIVLCTYFSQHMDRPETDIDTENEDNYYWGMWVMEKTDEALNLIADSVNNSMARTLSK